MVVVLAREAQRPWRLTSCKQCSNLVVLAITARKRAIGPGTAQPRPPNQGEDILEDLEDLEDLEHLEDLEDRLHLEEGLQTRSVSDVDWQAT